MGALVMVMVMESRASCVSIPHRQRPTTDKLLLPVRGTQDVFNEIERSIYSLCRPQGFRAR